MKLRHGIEAGRVSKRTHLVLEAARGLATATLRVAAKMVAMVICILVVLLWIVIFEELVNVADRPKIRTRELSTFGGNNTIFITNGEVIDYGMYILKYLFTIYDNIPWAKTRHEICSRALRNDPQLQALYFCILCSYKSNLHYNPSISAVTIVVAILAALREALYTLTKVPHYLSSLKVTVLGSIVLQTKVFETYSVS